MFSKKNYKLLRFEKSIDKPTKKYVAILQSKKDNSIYKFVYFGGIRSGGLPYSQYKDRVLGIYSMYNNLDKAKRANYHKRHSDKGIDYSPNYFSKKYLW